MVGLIATGWRYAAMIVVPVGQGELVQRVRRNQQPIQGTEHHPDIVPIAMFIELPCRGDGFGRSDPGQLLAAGSAQHLLVPEELDIFCKEPFFVIASHRPEILPATEYYSGVHAGGPYHGYQDNVGCGNAQ